MRMPLATRRFAAAAGLVLAACGGDHDPVSPEQTIAGAYTLRTIDGAALPVTVNLEDATFTVTRATLSLKADRTYSQSITATVTLAGTTVTQTLPDAGTYTVNGTTVSFVSASDGSSGTAAYANGTLTVSQEGTVLVYQR